MRLGRALSAQERTHGLGSNAAAHDLAARLPRLVLAAQDAASSYLHGAHGRRRSGPGDAFWQFRPFGAGEPASRIDWRRSARENRLYVREREWEAAHTIWLWLDVSPSMAFASDLALEPKLDRATTLGLALAEILVRAGERVGLLAMTPAYSSRDVIERFAQALLAAEKARSQSGETEAPPPHPLAARARALLIGDGLVAPELFSARLSAIAARGAKGYFALIADPVEETFPFEGHVELSDLDSSVVFRMGRAQDWRDDYIGRLSAHREALAQICRKHGFGFGVYRTDRPASAALLSLARWFEGGASR